MAVTEAVRRAEDCLLLDVRDAQSFAAVHMHGAVKFGLCGRFAEFAAALHAPKQEVVLIGSAAEVHEARLRLARVGIAAWSERSPTYTR
jgi:rhodanese-related sulfurtransferase